MLHMMIYIRCMLRELNYPCEQPLSLVVEVA
jgi:hypothetical protein